MDALEKHENAKLIFTGKIVHLKKGIERGFNIGQTVIQSFDAL